MMPVMPEARRFHSASPCREEHPPRGCLAQALAACVLFLTIYVAVLGLSCDVWNPCYDAYGILAPRPGIKLTYPTLKGGFLTTGPPGRSQGCLSVNPCFEELYYVLPFSVRVEMYTCGELHTLSPKAQSQVP